MRRTWTSPLRESKQRKDIAISERTRSLFDYKAAFNSSVEQVRSEGRYRVFADLKRVRGQFPQAVRRREDGSEQERKNMDRNADGVVSQKEVAASVARWTRP